MANKIGPLIKEARTAAGLTQEQLAKKVPGVSANDISKAERGELQLSQASLKEIARATGVTQTSLLEAAKKSTYSTKTTAKTTTKTTAKTTTSSTASKSSMQVTASERKLVELYRAANSDTKKMVTRLLKGETDTATELISSLVGGTVEKLMKK